VADAVCFDASVYVKSLVEESDSELAHALIADAATRRLRLVGPAFLPAEVLSVLRCKVARGETSADEGAEAITAFFGFPVHYLDDLATFREAWRIAGELAMPTVYDSVYLAVALAHDAPYWTADSVFYERARATFSAVKLLGQPA
jgi:predicted nucleic acid-binding protein